MSINLPVTRHDRGFRETLTIEEHLDRAQDERLHQWFLDKYGEQGEELYSYYTGKIPPKIVWKKSRKYNRIPSIFLENKGPLKFGSIKHKYPVSSHGKICFFEKYTLTPVNANDFQLRVYYELVSRGDLISQPHLTDYHERQRQQDGDLFLSSQGLDLAVSRKKTEVFIPEVDYTEAILDLELYIPEEPKKAPTFTEPETSLHDIPLTESAVNRETLESSSTESTQYSQPEKTQHWFIHLVQKVSGLAKAIFFWFISFFKQDSNKDNDNSTTPLAMGIDAVVELSGDESSISSDEDLLDFF